MSFYVICPLGTDRDYRAQSKIRLSDNIDGPCNIVRARSAWMNSFIHSITIKKIEYIMVYQNQWMSRASGSGSWNKFKSEQSGIVVPNRATFEYSYSVSSICTNRATVFVWLYSSTNARRYKYGYCCTNYDKVLLVLGEGGQRVSR